MVTVSSLVIIGVAILGLYFIGMSQVADALSFSSQRKHLARFVLGLVVTMVIFIPSPDLFGPDYRFTVNMAQMLLAVDLGPLLLFSGIPAVMLEPLVQKKGLTRFLSKPYWVGIASSLMLLIWFAPTPFEAASQNLTLWIVKQILFLLSGLLLWLPVASPVADWKPTYPIQLLYLFIMRLPMTVLGIMFTFADRLIYTARSFSLEICAPSSISDQQMGGLVIWTFGGLVMFAVVAFVFFRWFNMAEKAEIQ